MRPTKTRRRRLALRRLRILAETTFQLIHYCIVEVTILILAIIGAWKLIVHH